MGTYYTRYITQGVVKELRRLHKANEGDRKALQHVLDTAYGRKGKLKHELMKV